MRQGDVVHFLHTDHLGSTSLTTDATGAPIAQTRYLPYGEQRWTDGDTPTDFTFTGQRADSFGLLDYNARYYDAGLGRFISPDTIIPNPANPQSLNRYAYTYNNPLKYRDSSGHFGETLWDIANIVIGVGSLCYNLSEGNYVDAAIDTGGLVVDVAATALPFVPGGAGAAIKAVRVANKVDNVVDAAQSVRRTGDVASAVRSLTYLRHADSQAFETLMSLGKNGAAQIDNILANAGTDSVIRGMTDRAGNQVILTAGNRNKGLRHVVGRHLTGMIPGSATSFFPETAKVNDITNAIADVISNGTRSVDSKTSNFVYTMKHDTLGEMKVIVNEIGEVVSAYPTK